MAESKVDTTNPFDVGVSYKDFLSNVNKKVSEKSLLDKLKLSKEARHWIEQELKDYKQKQPNRITRNSIRNLLKLGYV